MSLTHQGCQGCFSPFLKLLSYEPFLQQVHARTHKCWSVACNCGVVVKEGQDVVSVNYCGNRHNPYVGFLSKREPLHGTGIEKSGNTYRVSSMICFMK